MAHVLFVVFYFPVSWPLSYSFFPLCSKYALTKGKAGWSQNFCEGHERMGSVRVLLCFYDIQFANRAEFIDPVRELKPALKVHKIENFLDSDFGICVISLLVMSKY